MRRRRVRRRGSSPLARGLLRRSWIDTPTRGIIPARAGFTSDHPGPGACVWDHPRSRGVYLFLTYFDDLIAGSSPLARGLRHELAPLAFRRGIIPARAGFTPSPSTPCAVASDHPRSRGVYVSDEALREASGGSSPLARGLRIARRICDQEDGIIPARAGFTHPRSTRPPRKPDHPRSRGVYWSWSVRSRCSWGSSPLARGLPSPSGTRHRRMGIIPARAGFTGIGTSSQ